MFSIVYFEFIISFRMTALYPDLHFADEKNKISSATQRALDTMQNTLEGIHIIPAMATTWMDILGYVLCTIES